MKLRPGITKVNIVGMYLIIFISFCALMMAMAFISFLIRDPEYYNIKDVGTVTGDIGLYCEIVVLVFDLCFGSIIDIVGRKGPLIVSIFSSGLALGLMPMFKTIYPQLLLLRIFA